MRFYGLQSTCHMVKLSHGKLATKSTRHKLITPHSQLVTEYRAK